MTTVERKIVEWLDRHKFALFIIAVSLLAFAARFAGKDMRSGDYHHCLEPWFEEIRDNGGLRALDKQVGNYNVIYQIIIALLTYLPFNPMYLYKAVSVVFDYVLAFGVGLLAMEYTNKRRSSFALAYAAVLLLPTCIFNSALWAQCDSIYVSMLVFWFLFMLRKRYIAAFVFLGIAFSLKFQTVFVLPFLIYHYVTRKEFSILHGLIPLAIVIIPCVLCGRHPLETFRIYMGQADTYKELYMNFPSFWVLVTYRYQYMGYISIFVAIGALGIGLLCVMYCKRFLESRENQLYMLIWTVWTCLMFLPSIHDRYGYLLEMLLIVAIFVNVKMLPIAVLVEASSVVTYATFLWKEQATIVEPELVSALMFQPAYMVFTCFLLYLGIKAKQTDRIPVHA